MDIKMNRVEPAGQNRDRVIIRTSVIGIAANLLLAAFKAFIGIVSNSIAVILDAVNNLSDALSSIITIVGTRLSAKLPDKKHPLGYGRVEYLSAMIVAGIVLYAGLTSLVESVKKIIRPEAADYSSVSLVIIAVAVIVKLVLGRYVKAQGEKVHSGALVASGSDAVFDAVLSLSVLASAIVYLLSGLSLEAYVGAVISLAIIKAGIEMMAETLNEVLGERGDAETSKKIKQLLSDEPEVRGAFDLILNNYGPDRNYASVHIELPDTMTVAQVDALTRRVEKKVFSETGVILTGVGVYSHNTGSGESAALQNEIRRKVTAHDWVLQLHGFYADIPNKSIRFDVVLSFDIDPMEGIDRLQKEMREAYPDYDFEIVHDVDASD